MSAPNFSLSVQFRLNVTFGDHLSHVSTLSGWASALSVALWFPLAFRRTAFASWDILCPLEISALVTHRLPESDILSDLALACPLDLASKVLRHLTLSADTAFPLLVEHSKADIRLNTSGGRILESSPTSPSVFESRA